MTGVWYTRERSVTPGTGAEGCCGTFYLLLREAVE